MAKGDMIEVQWEKGTFRVTEENEGECRYCHGPIVWCLTRKGRKMPVDALPPGEVTTSHFDTCPEREERDADHH